MIGVVVIRVVVIQVIVVVVAAVFKEGTAAICTHATHAARPRGRFERYGSVDQCLVGRLEQSACEREKQVNLFS